MNKGIGYHDWFEISFHKAALKSDLKIVNIILIWR